MAGIFVTLVVNLYFLAIFLVGQFICIGFSFSDLNTPLFLVEGYHMCASGATLGTLLFVQELLIIILSLLVTFITMVLSKRIGKNIFAILASFMLFLIGALVDIVNLAIYKNSFIINKDQWYLLSLPTFNKLLDNMKLLNPFSVINIQYYLEQPRYLTLGSLQYPLYYSPVIIMIVIIGISSIYLMQNSRR